MTSELVCLDNNILVWGVRKNATIGQENMIPFAQNFLKYLEDEDKKVMIPSVVVAEFLVPIPAQEHINFTSYFGRKFIVYPFDIRAASMYARIWQKRKEDGVYSQLKDEIGRDCVKADMMIAATAVVNGATRLYTNDGNLRKVAKGFIEAEDMPIIYAQSDFLDDIDDT